MDVGTLARPAPTQEADNENTRGVSSEPEEISGQIGFRHLSSGGAWCAFIPDDASTRLPI